MNREILLFRAIGENRFAVTLTVDENDVIISETPGHKLDPFTPHTRPKPAVKAVPQDAKSVIDAREARMVAQGIGFRREGNSLIIESVPPKFQKIMTFFSGAPCWFEGCEAVRKEYEAELAAMGEDCPDCQKGSLIRKYTDRISEILDALA